MYRWVRTGNKLGEVQAYTTSATIISSNRDLESRGPWAVMKGDVRMHNARNKSLHSKLIVSCRTPEPE